MRKKRADWGKPGSTKLREEFSAAEEQWSLRRDLFYAMCNILEGCYTDPKLEGEFRRQKARLEKRFGYDKEPIPPRITPEYKLSPAEVRRMKAAIRRNLKLAEPTWFRRLNKTKAPATSAPV